VSGTGFIYLASPYSHPDALIRRARYGHAVRFIGHLARCKTVIYSPIAHWHDAATRCHLPTAHQFWLDQNDAMLRASRGVFVLRLPDWEKSLGVAHEIELAAFIGLPVDHYEVEFGEFVRVSS
jgi:hypothetical protein